MLLSRASRLITHVASPMRLWPVGVVGFLRSYSDAPRPVLREKLRELDVNRQLRKALMYKPFFFWDLTDVQERVLNTVLRTPPGESTDVLCKARTGTGKTLAFLVPAIHERMHILNKLEHGEWMPEWFRTHLDRTMEGRLIERDNSADRARLRRRYRRNYAGVLVISPTRELAHQIAEEARKLVHHTSKGYTNGRLNVHELIGGEKGVYQLKHWDACEPDIVVGTPGRLLDLMRHEKVREPLSRTHTLVLDEADMLLELGFREEIQSIVSQLGPVDERQTFLFSATMDPKIMSVAEASMREKYHYIDCVPADEDPVHKHVPQYVTTVEQGSQIVPLLLDLITQDQKEKKHASKIMVFTPTTKLADAIFQLFVGLEWLFPRPSKTRLFRIHGGLTQERRTRISNEFRACDNEASIMVTSDVSARGVDYPGVTRVIQLGVPSTRDMYVHRVGRTGRGGHGGRADLIVSELESAFVTFQLQDLPLQPTTLSEQVQMRNEAAEHAQDTQLPSEEEYQRGITLAQQRMRHKCDTGSIFASLFGYYVSMNQYLRTSYAHVLEGVQDWIQGVFDLPTRPEPSSKVMRVVQGQQTWKSRQKAEGAKNTRGAHSHAYKSGRNSGRTRPPKHIRERMR